MARRYILSHNVIQSPRTGPSLHYRFPAPLARLLLGPRVFERVSYCRVSLLVAMPFRRIGPLPRRLLLGRGAFRQSPSSPSVSRSAMGVRVRYRLRCLLLDPVVINNLLVTDAYRAEQWVFTSVSLLMSAPRSSSTSIIDSLPVRTAQRNSVSPAHFLWKSAPRFRSNSPTAQWPALIALWRRLNPLVSA